jgi:hypothetical protein
LTALTLINVIASIASLVSFVLALVGISQASNLTKRLSTRFKGNFPDYLDAVDALLKDAKHSVKIMATVSSHGSFTCPESWERIKARIETEINQKKRSDKSFKAVLIYGSQKSCSLSSPAFELQTEAEFKIWANEKEQKQSIEDFFVKEFRLTPKRISQLTKAEYGEGRFSEHMSACRGVYREFERRRSDRRLPMYCWIIDDREAIFAISIEGETGRFSGAGIYTADPALLNSLTSMFEHFASDKNSAAVTTDSHWDDDDQFRAKMRRPKN